MDNISNIKEMNAYIMQRARSAAMVFDCGAGGLFTSQVAIVAEAPGARETELKTPLIGGSGKLLWDCIRKEGQHRNTVYITNVIKRQLQAASDRMGQAKSTVSKNEFAHWQALLRDELRRTPNVKYILALGNYALQALTGHVGIDNFRGSVFDITIEDRPFKVVACYNPAHVLRNMTLELTFRMDLHKLTRVIDGKHSVVPIKHLINPTTSEALDYLQEALHARSLVSYDIETLNNETACVGISYKPHEGMCINFRDHAGDRYSVEDERKIRLSIQRVLANGDIKLIAQNNNFDASWLWYKDRIKVQPIWMDTMLAHHLLYPTLPHRLGYLVSQYTDYPYHKDDGKEWRDSGNIDLLWEYNVKDCVTTRLVAIQLYDELRAAKLDQFFFNHVMRLQPHLVRMTVGGMKADTVLKEQFVERLGSELEDARNRINHLVAAATGDSDRTVNPSSPRQLGTLFFKDLRLVGRGASTDKENRERMRNHPRTNQVARDLLTAVDDYSAKQKALSTYADSKIDPDGRFRCEYRQTGVARAPGRLSSAGTLWGSGLNLQNIPEWAKAMFEADPSYELTYFDMAQIEARYVAYLADIPTWKEQFELARLNRGAYDAHRALASTLFKVPYDQVPSSDFDADGRHTIRYVAKRCRHGLNYRMEAPRLATTAGLSLSEAEAAYYVYHAEHPQLRVWWEREIADAKKDRELRSPLGRRWLLLERVNDDTFDSIVAFKPQSTAGDHVASVIYKCERDPRWPSSARFVLNIHDANVAMHKPEDRHTVRGLMRLYAEEPVYINGEPVITPADFAASQPDDKGVHRWSTLKKLKEVPEMLPPLNPA